MSEGDRIDEAVRAYHVPPPSDGLAERVARQVVAEAARTPARPRLRRALAAAALVGAGAALAVGGTALVRLFGDAITAGERVPAQRETIVLGRRAILVAERGSVLRWRPGPVVSQSHGEVFYRIDSGPFVVETPQGTVHVRGTCFRVEVPEMKLSRQAMVGAATGAALAGLTVVTVYEGRVSLASGAGQLELKAGESGMLRSAQPPKLILPKAAGEADVAPAEVRPAAAPAPLGTGPAGREVEALRARLSEQEKELTRLRQIVTPDKQRNNIDPSREELLARAQRCEVSYHYPSLDGPGPAKVGDKQASKLGLRETEREAVDEVLKEIHTEVPAALRKLYTEMSGDAAAAERLSPSTLLTEILQKAPEGVVAQARTRLARERAGLVAPGSSSAGPVAERALRVMVDIGDDFESRLGERLGAGRARSLRSVRESWGHSSTMSGCP